MRSTAIIGALTAVGALLLGGPVTPAATGSAELAFDRGGWIYVSKDDGTGVRRLIRGSGAAYSPDGSRLAFARSDRLFVAHADGTGERQLSRAGRGYGVEWSPDGRKIAFTSHYRSGRQAVYVASADGTRVRPLMKATHRLEESGSPAWSPDGRLIAFASTRAAAGNPEIFVARADGTGVRRLTHTAGGVHVLGDDGMPSWSRDGRRIVFTSNRTGDGAIWVMRADGTNERRVYDRKGTDEFDPEFSADGRRIAFSQLGPATAEIWIVSSQGSGAQHVAAGGRPTWLPDRASRSALAGSTRAVSGLSSDVLFTRHLRGTGTSDLYLAHADGSPIKRLTRDGSSAGGVFSPDGTQIAFVSGRATGPQAPELFVMGATGTSARRLTHSFRSPGVFWQNTHPVWAPDGKSIVFVRTKIVGTREETDLWRVDARGGTPARLTRHPGREANPAFTPDGGLGFDREGRIRILLGGTAIDARAGADPNWSPDHSYLAFVKSDGIYLTLGQSERRVVEGGFSPAWSSDGKQLIYQAAGGGLEAMTLMGREEQAVTHPPRQAADLYPSWRPTPRKAAALLSQAGAPNGHVVFSRRTGTGRSELFLVRADGSGLRRLSSEPVDFDPAWTPDGKRIVFSTTRGGRDGAPELYARNLSGTYLARITTTPNDSRRWAANVEPVVAADGKRVIFVQERYRDGVGTRDLYSIALSGGPLRQLTRTPGQEASPAIGRSRAIYFERDGWIYETALGATRRIARGVHPAKDPSRRGLVAFAQGGAIFVSWGGPPMKVVEDNGSGGFSEPAWSPDGERLVFVAPDGLFTVALDGSDLRRLTKTPAHAHDLTPAWQPEGSR